MWRFVNRNRAFSSDRQTHWDRQTGSFELQPWQPWRHSFGVRNKIKQPEFRKWSPFSDEKDLFWLRSKDTFGTCMRKGLKRRHKVYPSRPRDEVVANEKAPCKVPALKCVSLWPPEFLCLRTRASTPLFGGKRSNPPLNVWRHWSLDHKPTTFLRGQSASGGELRVHSNDDFDRREDQFGRK